MQNKPEAPCIGEPLVKAALPYLKKIIIQTKKALLDLLAQI